MSGPVTPRSDPDVDPLQLASSEQQLHPVDERSGAQFSSPVREQSNTPCRQKKET